MKKVLTLLLGLSMSVSSIASSKDSCCQQKGLMKGRTIYVSGSYSTCFPPLTYGASVEAGLCGISKNTSFAIVMDFMRTTDSLINEKSFVSKSKWIGVKGYLTFYENDNSCYFIYLSPKISLGNSPTKGLLEIGINPNFNINKHILLSPSICDQILENSTWNPGGSIGITILL